MSRIHDALKKAEQERMGGVRPAPGTSALDTPPATVPADEVAGTHTEGRMPATALRTAAIPEVLTIETLQSRCPVSAWNPDPKRIVAYLASENRLGNEEFRSLRSRLYQSRDTGPLRRVLITSPLPQEGKTYVATNLAYAIVRQRERRVLLVDADLRWSRLHTMLGTNLSLGLTDYLRGEADVISILQRGPLDNFYFIPGGKSASNPVELIANGRLKVLFDQLTPLFDWIIVDSPPAVTMSDASLLAELCDGVLLVVAAGKTPFDLAQKTREQFKKSRLLGAVLNRVEPYSTGSHYYYGYYRRDGKNQEAKR